MSYGAGYGPYVMSGAPVVGTDAVQTLTIGGTPTGGTLTPEAAGISLGPVNWSNVNATFVAALQAAIDAKFGAAQVVATIGTMTAGIGTILLTFSGANVSKKVQPTWSVTHALTGTTPTAAMATTTPGVNATLREALPGAILIRTDTPGWFQKAGTAAAPTWVPIT